MIIILIYPKMENPMKIRFITETIVTEKIVTEKIITEKDHQMIHIDYRINLNQNSKSQEYSSRPAFSSDIATHTLRPHLPTSMAG